MRDLRQHSGFGSWPFWLLIVAWFCANIPGRVTSNVMAWVIDAGSISHQQRLETDVARISLGEQSGEQIERRDGAREPVRPFGPALPSEAKVKKIELATEGFDGVSPRAERDLQHRQTDCEMNGVRRDRPPHGPPRGAVRV